MVSADNTVFLVTLLMGLNILVLSKDWFYFYPPVRVWVTVMLPQSLFQGSLYYLLNQSWTFGKAPSKRIITISIVFILIAIILDFGCRYFGYSSIKFLVL